MNEFLPAFTLWRREVVRFLRQPNRVFGAIGSPVLFWLILGSGVGRSFRAPGAVDGRGERATIWSTPSPDRWC